MYLCFYNEEKGEFYTVEDGELVIFTDYADCVLHNSSCLHNANARDFATRVFHSDIDKNPYTLRLYEEMGVLDLFPWFDASMDPEDFFNFQYNGQYYTQLWYYIEEDQYALSALGQDVFDSYIESGALDGFAAYTGRYVPGDTLEITGGDLKNLSLRRWEFVINAQNVAELTYFQPFHSEEDSP